MTLHISDYDKERLLKIKAELNGKSFTEIKSFEKLFPSWSNALYVDLVLSDNIGYDYYFSNIDKFWSNWHKFKTLKSFL